MEALAAAVGYDHGLGTEGNHLSSDIAQLDRPVALDVQDAFASPSLSYTFTITHELDANHLVQRVEYFFTEYDMYVLQ